MTEKLQKQTKKTNYSDQYLLDDSKTFHETKETMMSFDIPRFLRLGVGGASHRQNKMISAAPSVSCSLPCKRSGKVRPLPVCDGRVKQKSRALIFCLFNLNVRNRRSSSLPLLQHSCPLLPLSPPFPPFLSSSSSSLVGHDGGQQFTSSPQTPRTELSYLEKHSRVIFGFPRVVSGIIFADSSSLK